MPPITYLRTIALAAEILNEDTDLLAAVVANDDNLSYGSIVTIYDSGDEATVALNGIAELRQLLLNARRSPVEWSDFLDFFVDDNEVAARFRTPSHTKW